MILHQYPKLSVTHAGDECISSPGSAQARVPLTFNALRMNLTGLSQLYNLYFVAGGEHVLVYEPQYPRQTLGQCPGLIIDTPPLGLGRPGNFHDQPHSINNLVVAKFGDEEILAVVRDDGDLDAYLTRHILDQIREAGGTYSARPFCHYNVRDSAWGLAIHAQARLIAVSSNGHKITIFKFGLVTDTKAGRDGSEDEILGGQIFSIHNGPVNIPCIAFCNTGHDPEGRWLLSTDIAGHTRSWDLHRHHLQQTFWLGDRAWTRRAWEELEFSGWGLLLLDPRSFPCVPTRPLDQLNADELVLSLDTSKPIWDISSMLDRLGRINVPISPFINDLGDVASRHGLHDPIENPDIGSVEEIFAIRGDHATKLDVEDRLIATWTRLIRCLSFAAEPETADDKDLLPSVLTKLVNIQDPHPSELELLHRVASRWILSGTGMKHILLNHMRNKTQYSIPVDLSHDIQRVGTFIGLPQTNVVFKEPRSMLPDFPCPILLTWSQHIALIQPSYTPCSDTGSSPGLKQNLPVIFLNDPCSPEFLEKQRGDINWGLSDRRPWDRICYHAEIAEIGVVILGNQTGAVSVLSLFKTQIALDLVYDDTERIETEKCVYGMSPEYVLPIKETVNDQTPQASLYGLSVGPIQGTYSLPSDLKRWRLMLMYNDGSVLSYEIGRARPSTP